MSRRARTALAIAAVTAPAALAYRRRTHARRAGWPPPVDAVTSSGAEAATAALAAGPRRVALDFAWSTAATIEPWVDGESFFPRIFADVEAARSSVHILMFGWREGSIGTRLAALLERKLAEGVEVRVIVDAFGSRPYREARAMFAQLAARGAEIVVHDVLPPRRGHVFPAGGRHGFLVDGIGRVDHRKLYVVDGETAWTGGAGIEDHFDDGRFHDVMVRVTGDVVRQAQAAFFASFRGYGGRLPTGLSRYFPEPADAGSTPIALTQVITGGHATAAYALREQIDGARERLDVINAYLTDRGVIARILAAARRGVAVRVVVAETSNNKQAAAAFRHRYGDLTAAGVDVRELQGAVVHAKVVIADDVVSFGTVNLDAWALYRNSEIMMIARSAEAAALMEERLFEPALLRSRYAEAPTGARERLESLLWNKLAFVL